jgi:hypothetical protein
MIRINKPDGVIEMGISTCCCPPGDKHGGVHTRGFTNWWRVAGGEWQRIKFGIKNAEEFASISKSCAEFAQFAPEHV